MAADYFVRAVAVDALRALIPAGDVAGGVEHEDGVVLHPVDHQLVNAVAALDRFGESGVGDRRDGSRTAIRRVARLGTSTRERVILRLIVH